MYISLLLSPEVTEVIITSQLHLHVKISTTCILKPMTVTIRKTQLTYKYTKQFPPYNRQTGKRLSFPPVQNLKTVHYAVYIAR